MIHGFSSEAAETRENAFHFLDTRRRPDSWVGELSSSALSNAMSSLALSLHPEAAPRSAWESGLAWFEATQNSDGDWGNGHGADSTAGETAWAVAALLRLGSPGGEAVERGVRWLVDDQRDDGGWDPGVVGVYFSSVVYSNLSYAVSYPPIALSRYLASGTG